MEKKMKDFLNCLDNEIDIYRDILSLVEEEKRILVKNEELQLNEVVKKQDKFIRKIETEEKERIRLLGTLTQEEKESEDFKDRMRKMKSLIIRISEVNNNNVFLIEQGRKDIRAFLDLILKKGDSKLYSSNGRISSKSQGNIFINETI